jgi:hypothetical protein
MKRFLLGLVATAMIVVGLAGVASAHTAKTFPPGAKPYGQPYPQWAKRWARWAFDTPVPTNPLVHPELCGTTSHGVRFLPAVGLGTTLTIKCIIPAGTPLLVSPGGDLASGVTGDGFTKAKLKASVNTALDATTDVRLTVDGRRIRHILAYRVTTCRFPLTLPANNLFGVPPQTTPALAGGWFVMLRPLSVGWHKLVANDAGQAGIAHLVIRIRVVA